MSSNHIKNVAIVGAGGRQGKWIAEELVKGGKHDVTAITRADSTSTIPMGLKRANVNYDEESTLVDALKGQDALVITMSVTAPGDSQAKLIQAAAKAGVPWILPNEWGSVYDDPQVTHDTFIGLGNLAARKLISDLGLNWVGVACGFWYDYSLGVSKFAFGFDHHQKEVTFYDDGNTKITTSTWSLVGKAVATLLSLPIETSSGPSLSDWKDKMVRVSSFIVSQKDMFESVKRVTTTTDKDWTIKYEPTKQRYEEGVKIFDGGKGSRFGFVQLLYSRYFYADGSGNISSHGLDNEKLGLPKEDFDAVTKIGIETGLTTKYLVGKPESILEESTETGYSDPVSDGREHRDSNRLSTFNAVDENQVPFKVSPAVQTETESPSKAPRSRIQEDPGERLKWTAEEQGSWPRGGGGKQVSSGSFPTLVLSSSRSDSSGTLVWEERPKFEKALARVIDMLPGEMHMRDLLRQVEGTGKEKLREMGLRVRAYKSYFEAWEDLHLGFDAEGGTYVRDDVVQYLRSHQHSDVSDGVPIMSDLGLAQQIHAYESYRFFLAKFGQLLFPWTAPYFSDHMTLHAHFKRGGRGIVLTAGDDQAAYLLTSIPIMRQLGCTLPIEVMYLGDTDLSEDFRADLEALEGVITRDIAQMVNDEGWKLAGWAAKPFAILFSSFREAIFIDADSLFFRNPEVLFDDPAYQATGALFFRDRIIMPENKKRWLQQILPKPISKQAKQSRFWTGDSGHMQESGVVVVDKWRHFMALLLITRMNGPDRDGNKAEGRVGVYDMVYGDKETFWIGWELVGDLDYAFHQGDAGIMGQLLHLDTDGKPLWFNGWLLDNKFAEKKQKKFGLFVHYLIEPREVRDPVAWQLEESNMCCLTTDPDKKFDFSDAEKKLLQDMMTKAREVGAPGSG
ncbi:hypothetical protein DV737_g984, partial [Chaetothyriales sp. CBS 132003]